MKQRLPYLYILIAGSSRGPIGLFNRNLPVPGLVCSLISVYI